MTTAPLVRVRGLTKSYGDRDVLHGVDLDVHDGEILALLGPNGSGKTTTIEILEGYRVRTAGSVEVLGHDPQRAPVSWRAGLGIVLQSSGESTVSTVREALRDLAALYPNPRDVDQTIADVGLTAHAGRRISALSGGQQRRVDVAMGVIGRPRLLFLDEPTTGFDAEARHQFWDFIRTLRDEGTTMLLTTHYLDEAAQLADRIVVLTGGRITAEGTPATVGGADARVPIVRWGEGGERHEERTATPGAFVADLVGRVGEPTELEIVRPSLEDIYLAIVQEHDTAPAATAKEPQP